jgi:arsenite-transporting ATPase
MKRLYIFTGKGGVGKTAFSMAFTRHLQQAGYKARYNSFDQAAPTGLCDHFGLNALELSNAESASKYIEKKLGSAIVAKWILKTPFFSSLFDMLPSLGHMILFGHLVDLLRNDPELTIVMDSPSSGHALTMFEASFNFLEMFKSGMIVEDIHKMHEFLYEKESIQTFILALPTLMATQESTELKAQLETLHVSTQILLNESYLKIPALNHNQEELPEFLKKKLSLEQEVVEANEQGFTESFQHYPSTSLAQTIDFLTSDMDKLV